MSKCLLTPCEIISDALCSHCYTEMTKSIYNSHLSTAGGLGFWKITDGRYFSMMSLRSMISCPLSSLHHSEGQIISLSVYPSVSSFYHLIIAFSSLYVYFFLLIPYPHSISIPVSLHLSTF